MISYISQVIGSSVALPDRSGPELTSTSLTYRQGGGLARGVCGLPGFGLAPAAP